MILLLLMIAVGTGGLIAIARSQRAHPEVLVWNDDIERRLLRRRSTHRDW